MQDEHEGSLASRARGSHHRRYDSDDDGQMRNEYWRTEGMNRPGFSGGCVT